ncbi:dynein light chain type 1 domain-containing protein [Ditylenchus destructor]|nr:dynein light chain type 1 domain-containing protein [Ditylenchus destructor]
MISKCRRFYQSCQGEDRAWQLRNQLAKNYDNATANPNSTITRMVRIESVRLSRIEIDEAKQLVRLFARLVLSWNDSKVTCNKVEWRILGSIYIGYSYGPHSSFKSMLFTMNQDLKRFLANVVALSLTFSMTGCFLFSEDLTPGIESVRLNRIEIDEAKQLVRLFARMVLSWNDSKVTWNKQEWGILGSIYIGYSYGPHSSFNSMRMSFLCFHNEPRSEAFSRKRRRFEPDRFYDLVLSSFRRPHTWANNTIYELEKSVDNLNKQLREQKNKEACKLVLITVGVALASIYIGFGIASVKAYWKATIDTAYEEFHVGNEMSKDIREFAQSSLTEIRKHHNEDWAQRLQQKMNKKFPPAGWLCVMGTDHSTLQSFSSNVNSHQLYMFGIVKKVFVLFKMT